MERTAGRLGAVHSNSFGAPCFWFYDCLCVPEKPLGKRLIRLWLPAFFEKTGYDRADLDGMLTQLAYRLETQTEFPHEIGVFLGYPLQDVIGFIENQSRNFTCRGFWKSYSDPAEIQTCFDCYRRCINTYVKLFEQGIPLEKLAVPA